MSYRFILLLSILNFLFYPLAKGKKGLWVWNTRPDDKEVIDNLLGFCNKEGISTIFFSVGWIDNLSKCKPFLEKATGQGIDIHALLGTPEWGYTAHQYRLLSSVERILDYNRNAPKDARFSAIHLDIEPYNLPLWHKDIRNASLQFLSSMEIVRRKTLREGIEFYLDIPCWFSKIVIKRGNETKPLSHFLLDITDGVAIMDYVVKEEKIVKNVEKDLDYADKKGKRVWIGFDFTQSSEPGTSFFRFSYNRFHNIAMRVKKRFQRHQSFLGFAFHDYNNYFQFRED